VTLIQTHAELERGKEKRKEDREKREEERGSAEKTLVTDKRLSGSSDMDLKTGMMFSLPLLLVVFTACSDAFALRKPENEDLVSALARLDRALGQMINRADGSIPYKRTHEEPRNESLDRVLRYLLDMEDRLHERNTQKRDHDDQ
jgi:hypothetical protein